MNIDDSTKLRNAVNFIRSRLQEELHPKMDKTIDYSKVVLLQKTLNILT